MNGTATTKNELINKENIQIKNKLISNTFYLFFDWFAVTVTGFFYWLVAGKLLLPEDYGIVSTAINFALILSGLSLLGMHAAIWKLVPEYLARGQKIKINSLIKFSFVSVLISNTVVLFIILSFSRFLSPLLKMPPVALLMSGLVLFSYAIVLLFRYVIYGFQNMRVLTVTDFIGQSIKVFVSPILILLGFKYLGPLAGFLLGSISIILLRIKYIPLRNGVEKINKKFIFFNYALPALITMVAWLIFFNGQYVLLSVLKNPQVTGIYTVAMTLSSVLAVVPTTLNSALLPITSQLSIRENTKKKQSRLIELIFRYGLLITLPLGILLIVFSETAVLLFSRVEYIEASRFIPLLVLGSIAHGIGSIFLENIYAIGKTKVYRNIMVVVSAVFLMLAFPLIYLFSAFGSALAYVITTLLWASLSFLYIRKVLGFKPPLADIGKLLISISIFFVFLNVVTSFSQNILFKGGLTCVGVLLYLIVLITLRFFSKDDIRICDSIVRKSPVLNRQIVKLWDFLLRFLSKS